MAMLIRNVLFYLDVFSEQIKGIKSWELEIYLAKEALSISGFLSFHYVVPSHLFLPSLFFYPLPLSPCYEQYASKGK